MVEDPRAYDFQSASWIAQEHATGATLLALHESHPDAVPAPMIVQRWRREFPAFDVLMAEAEHARADVLVDATLGIADSDKRTAGAARNSIQARQWMAGKLNQDRYGSKKHVEATITHEGTVKHESMSVYSDADLQAIIRGGQRQEALEGESTRIDQATPAPPPGEKTVGLEQNDGSDPSTPKISEQKQPVTTNKLPPKALRPLPDQLTSDPLAKDAPQPGELREPVYHEGVRLEFSDEPLVEDAPQHVPVAIVSTPDKMGSSMAKALGIDQEPAPIETDKPEEEPNDDEQDRAGRADQEPEF